MHHWPVGGTVSVGWPQFQRAERSYEIVELELLGRVFRARVTDGEKQGGFLVVLDCPAPVLEQLAELASRQSGSRSSFPACCAASMGSHCGVLTTSGTRPRNSLTGLPCSPVP